ncbi:MAG: zf-HC2 domain-containing protein [Acidobacteriota bacterium]
MTDSTLNTCGEQEHLVSYLYDELEPSERARVDEHLSTCAECRAALDGMQNVRVQLATWQLPEDAGAGAGQRIAPPAGTGSLKTGGYTRPWWAPGAVAAAAVVLLAVAAAIANLEITYGRDGISIRTGWSRTPAAAQTAAAVSPSQPPGVTRVEAQTVSAADLVALEKRLRSEFHALAAGASGPARVAAPVNAPAGASAEVLRRVQDLIDQSEARQRRELALRVAQVVRDFDTQRQTDLVRIQQGLGQIEGSTAADRQVLNYLVRVSQRQK